MRLRHTTLLVLAALVVGAFGGGRLGVGVGAGRSPGGRDGARIERVVDGDTVVISGLGKARLIGIDTPEVFGGTECFGREASAYAKALLPAGTPVRYRLGTEPRDRYGRALIYLFLRDGRHVNELLARNGYAQPLTIAPNVDYAQRFRALSREARRAGRGLWSACAHQ
jgi:micrococcal nuclease